MSNKKKKKLASLSLIAFLLGAVGAVSQMTSSKDIAYAATGKQHIIFSADANVASSSLNIAKKYLITDTDHITGQSYWQNQDGDFGMAVYNLAPDNKRIMFSASLQWMKDSISIGKSRGVDILAYDAELWEFTPSWELTHPIESFNQAADIAHSNGFKFAYHPTMKIFRGPDVNYLKQDWTKADVVVIPYGGLVVYPSGFKLQVQKAVDHIKSKNPNIEIYIFVSLRYATPSQIIAAMDSVKTMVHGAAVSYHPENGCTYCSDANLDKLLAGITALSSATSGTTTPPPPTTTPEELDLLYSSGSTEDTTTNIAKTYLTADSQNYAAQGYWQTIDTSYNNEVYSAAPNNNKVMFAASLEALQESIPTAKAHGVDVLAYNARIWKYATLVEQNDPVTAFNQASQTAHSNGFKFAYAPSLRLFAGPDTNYLKQDWTKADMLILPYAHLVTDPTEFKANIEQAVSHIKAENPNIQILVNISLKYGSPQTIVDSVNLVRPVVDGTALTHNPQESGCTYCSNANLDALLQGVA